MPGFGLQSFLSQDVNNPPKTIKVLKNKNVIFFITTSGVSSLSIINLTLDSKQQVAFFLSIEGLEDAGLDEVFH